jgi:hypothetical protein
MGSDTAPYPQPPTVVSDGQPLAPLLVDEREARRLLGGLCPKTMFNLRRSGLLPFVKIGSRVMYRPTELAIWIERQRGGPQE